MRKGRHFRPKDIELRKQKYHDELVRRILDDPGMVEIDQVFLDPRKVIYKNDKEGVWVGIRNLGYMADIVLLRETGFDEAEMDVIEALSYSSGIAMESKRKRLETRLIPFVDRYPERLVKHAINLGMDRKKYESLCFDIQLAYPGYSGLIEFHRLPGFEKRFIEMG